MEVLRVRFGKDRYHLHKEMEEWCQQFVGTGQGGWAYKVADGNDWSIESMFGITTFEFRRKEDALMFHLKWGGDIVERSYT